MPHSKVGKVELPLVAEEPLRVQHEWYNGQHGGDPDELGEEMELLQERGRLSYDDLSPISALNTRCFGQKEGEGEPETHDDDENDIRSVTDGAAVRAADIEGKGDDATDGGTEVLEGKLDGDWMLW